MKMFKFMTIIILLTFICPQSWNFAGERGKLTWRLSTGSTCFTNNVVKPLELTIEPRISNTRKSLTGLSPEIRIECDLSLTDRLFTVFRAGYVFPKTFSQQFDLPNEANKELIQMDKISMNTILLGIGYTALSNSNFNIAILAGGELNYIYNSFGRRSMGPNMFGPFGRSDFGNLHQANIGFWLGNRIEKGRFFIDVSVHFFKITFHGDVYSQVSLFLSDQITQVTLNEKFKAEDYWELDNNKMTTVSICLGIKL